MKALVIGGGIGGATAAIALRTKGIDAQVFERAGALSEVEIGAGIHIWSNAMRALQQIDVGDRVFEVSGPGSVVERLQFKSITGEVLADWPIGDIGRQAGAPTIGINRAELHRALTSALDEGVIHVGKDCVGFDQDGTSVTARFANGDEATGDILIGADGINSAIRTQMFGEMRPRYAGYTIWQGVIDFEHAAAPIGLFPLVYGRGERFAFYRVNQTRVYWFAVANAPEGGKDAEGTTKSMLLDRFRGWPEPTVALIEATHSSIRRKDLYDQKPMERWGEGRVTLLGDAAHAMTFDLGQGAGQSMEDAVVLADELTRHTDPFSALRSYETRRRKRSAHFQRLSHTVGRMGQLENPVAAGLRGWTIKHLFTRSFVINNYRNDMVAEF